MPQIDWLLDTSILVDLFRGSLGAEAWIERLPAGSRFVSVITAAELLAGCRNRTEQRKLDQELRQYTMLLIDNEISQTALGWYKQFHLSGGVCFFDCMIAATAARYNLKIATQNIKHFKNFPDIHAARPY